jgi:hypothetical protein
MIYLPSIARVENHSGEQLHKCGSTLASASSCQVFVAFKPAAVASYTAALSVADDGASSAQSVALLGTVK